MSKTLHSSSPSAKMKLLVVLLLALGSQANHTSYDEYHKKIQLLKAKAKIETVNPEYTPNGQKLYQGDMILSQEQHEWLSSPIDTRKAKIGDQYRWPNGVVQFRIDRSSMYDRQAILRGMQHWVENSCITFQEVPANYQAPHLIFQKLDGCFSAVGRQYYTNGQEISIGYGCEEMGTVAHEIGHAIGFYHEQSRPDRDNYVVVLGHNMDRTMGHNFDKERDINNYQIPYDMTSVMHYGQDGFSINGGNTLVTKDPFKNFVIGQREKLSFLDSKLANVMYNCAARCGANQCANGGYTNKNCRCVCPPGTSGDRCQYREQVPSGLTCGGEVTTPTTISTPNHPNNYPADTKCVWWAKAPAGRRVRATFTRFHTAESYPDNNWCVWDYLEVRTEDIWDGDKFCNKELQGKSITSETGNMILLFKAETNFFPGFQAKIDFV